jgi:3-methyladenine DNA glycosylase AlkD
MNARGVRPSPVTQRSVAFVEAHRARARGLGAQVGDLFDRPDEFLAALEEGLAALADPEYAAGLTRVAPGVGSVLGVRTPLLQAVARGLGPSIRRASPAEALWLAEQVAGAEAFETRTFAAVLLRRSLPADPERSWQLVRRMAAQASSWVEVDTLARVAALGIVREPYRWAELGQLVYSPDRWERRLVGSTIASVPLEVPTTARQHLARSPALQFIGQLMGDDEPDVQKALSWALRTWARVDPGGVSAFLEVETRRAAAGDDGNRAWVIRDSLQALPAHTAADLRDRLAGIRRRPGAAGTSAAGETARAFARPAGRRSAGVPAGDRPSAAERSGVA